MNIFRRIYNDIFQSIYNDYFRELYVGAQYLVNLVIDASA